MIGEGIREMDILDMKHLSSDRHGLHVERLGFNTYN
jgi:hypothetical protein